MDLKDIKGVGDKIETKLNELGIFSIDDLMNFLPSHYIDLSSYDDINNVEIGEYALLRVTVTSIGSLSKTRKNLNYFKVIGESGNQKIELVWFNQPYLYSKLELGAEYTVWGKLTLNKFNGYEMINANFENSTEIKKLHGIVPIYRLKGIISQTIFSKIVKNALQFYKRESVIRREFELKYELMNINRIYYDIHCPDKIKDAIIAQDRLAIDDCVDRITAFRYLKDINSRSKMAKFMLDKNVIDDFIRELPFVLSDSQIKSVDEVISDMRSEHNMNRILLGDVGSGKTIVAFITMYYAVKCGYQCALMVPTEILSVQHYNNAKMLFDKFGINVKLLNASMTKREKAEIINEVNNGKIHIVIGTHSLLNEDIVFEKLGYVVIDELHKFGVRQKGVLEDKMKNIDSLVMSATPIPRSVALIYYGDLSISKLDKRYGVDNIKTYLFSDNKLSGMYDYIKKNVDNGKQCYIVCPLVEDDDGNEMFSAKDLYKELSEGVFSKYRLGLIYGKMKDVEKSIIMREFRDGKIDILVATTVIEVGIDVKNANQMVIFNASRFGLASLHQLRGRIGRDGAKAECFLHYRQGSNNDRLKIMCNCSDGYDIAEYDLDTRGCGDYLGTNQSGGSKYTFTINKRVISLSRTIADEIMNKYSISEMINPRIESLVSEMSHLTIN